MNRALLGPAASAAVDYFRRPVMPEGAFSTVWLFDHAAAPPMPFHGLEALARHVHAERRGFALELVDDTMQMQGQPSTRPVVSIYLSDGGSRTGFLGHAWLAGRDRLALEAALTRTRPDRTPHVVAS